MRPLLFSAAVFLLASCGPKNPETSEPPPAEAEVEEVTATPAQPPAPEASEAAPPPDSRAAPTKGELACPGISSSLSAFVGGATGGRLVTDAEGRASVAVSLTAADTALPEVLIESSRRDSTAYGHVAAADLCTLAATEGVTGVRAADAASPK